MYTVFGYNELCEDFSYKFNSFVSAVKFGRKLGWMCVTFMMRDKANSCLHVKF